MVEIFVRPEWATPTIITLLAITIAITVIGIILELSKKTRWTVHLFLSALALFVLTFVLYGITNNGLFNESKTVNNPLAVSEEYKGSAIVPPEEIENVIVDEFNLDKIMLKDDNGKDLFEILSKGDFIEFTALRDGQKMDGTVYFTEKSMVINLAVESDNVEVVEVTAK